MKYLVTNKKLNNINFPHMNGCVSKTIKGSVKVYHESSKMISFGNSISIIEGYLFNLNTKENRVVSALKELLIK